MALSRRLNLDGPQDEIKQLGDTIDAMLARLQAAFEAQGRFAANASHELRTPLTITQASLEIPLQQGLISEEARPDVERALEAAIRSEALITALLDLADARRALETDMTRVNLPRLAEEEVRDVADLAAGAAVTVDVGTVSEVEVFGNTALLRTAVRNVLRNAVVYNVPGGTVEVRIYLRGQHAVLEVSNTGEPLSPAAVPLLVEPFHRGDRSRSSSEQTAGRRHHGLGLAIVDSVVQAHNGRLTLTARESGGLHLQVHLPRANRPVTK